MLRRHFLSATASAAVPLAIPGAGPAFAPRLRQLLSAADGGAADRVLVLIQLTGGNDGLNTVVPLSDYDDLAAVRPNVILPRGKLLKLDDTRALHPELTGIRDEWGEGRIRIVQGVGYPDQNRSHFRSTDIWNSGSAADVFSPTGWMGRALDVEHPDFPTGYPNASFRDPIAVSIGSSVTETCQGLASNYAYTLTNPSEAAGIVQVEGSETRATWRGTELNFLRTAVAQSNLYGGVVQEKFDSGRNGAAYPGGNGLAKRLSYVARMINGGLGTRVYHLNLGGFDTHAGQVSGGDTATGKHASLLRELSGAIAAFLGDLRALGLANRVVGMTYSEFGRRIRDNGSLGTDHGTAAPMFVFGEHVRAGVLGGNTRIDRQVDELEAEPMQYDFRDVYGSLLEDWFGVAPADVRRVLHPEYTRLPIIRDGGVESRSPDNAPANEYDFGLTPTNFESYTQITFTTPVAARVRLSAYDVEGRLLETLVDRRLPAATRAVTVEAGEYPPGIIIFRLQVGSVSTVLRGVHV